MATARTKSLALWERKGAESTTAGMNAKRRRLVAWRTRAGRERGSRHSLSAAPQRKMFWAVTADMVSDGEMDKARWRW